MFLGSGDIMDRAAVRLCEVLKCSLPRQPESTQSPLSPEGWWWILVNYAMQTKSLQVYQSGFREDEEPGPGEPPDWLLRLFPDLVTASENPAGAYVRIGARSRRGSSFNGTPCPSLKGTNGAPTNGCQGSPDLSPESARTG